MSLTEADKTYLKKVLDTQTEALQESIRGLNENFNTSQGKQNEQLKQLDAKLDAVMGMLVLRKEYDRMRQVLVEKGIATDEELTPA